MSARVFLGSSTEGLKLARSIQQELRKVATVVCWDQGVFQPGDFALDRLIKIVNEYDFAIFVISPDDIADLRGKRVIVARDNVLFEAGLFFSQLDRHRTFLIKPDMSSGPPFHLPSDLEGLTLVQYSPPDNPDDLRAAIGAACFEIETAIEAIGPRQVREALRKIDLLSGGPISLLRHVELRTHKLSELACILRYFNNAEGDASVAWPKAAQYAVQTLSILGLIRLAADEAYIIDAGKEFLAHPDVKNRFNQEFEKNLCPEEKKISSSTPEGQEYVRKLTFRLVKEPATENDLNAGRIPAGVSGNEESFALFGFRTAASRSWDKLEEKWRSEMTPVPEGGVDPVKLWVANVAQKMLLAIGGEGFDDGLPLFFSHFTQPPEQGLFRPSLARLASYSDAYEFDIVFIDVPPEFVAMSKGPLTAVLGLLKLANMFRFGWIEPKAKDAARRQRGDIPEDILRRFGSIAAESFTLGLDTEQAVLLAFNEDDPMQREESLLLQREVSDAMEAWKRTVFPEIQGAVEAKDNVNLLEAFGKASAINWKFHRACAQRYFQIVSKLTKAAIGPLTAV